MSLPDKATKHIPKHQEPIGAVKNGKVKVLDGDTQKIGWRQGTTGMSKDYDGEPTSARHNVKDLKPRPKHHSHMGNKKEGHKPHQGQRDPAYKKEQTCRI